MSNSWAFISCFSTWLQLLQSFKIMDYSLLVGIHNLDQARREQASQEAAALDQRKPQVQQKSLYSTAIEAIQADSGGAGLTEPEDTWVTLEGYLCRNFLVKSLLALKTWSSQIKTHSLTVLFLFSSRNGGIPARNAKGERLLVYMGIIDILQSYRYESTFGHCFVCFCDVKQKNQRQKNKVHLA